MRKERRIRILRRFVIGLAVAAVVAPAAQARFVELGGAKGSNAGSPVLQGDDKVILPAGGSSTVLIHGDDKVIAPAPGDYTLASPNTFDWGDAFVGAGVVFALMLLAGGAALGTRRRARPTAA
jgi:hypothetical protein